MMLLKDMMGGALMGRPAVRVVPRPSATPTPDPPTGAEFLEGAIRTLRVRVKRWAPPAHAAAAEHSFRAFIAQYLSHHFDKGFCEMHDDLLDRAEDPGVAKRVARIAPRKFGKTTLYGLALPLWKLAYKKKWFVLMVGESLPSAQANLQSIIEELEQNEKLRHDFPHLAPAIDRKGQFTKWTDHQLVFKSGATILAKGMGSKMRGVKFKNHRPDLAILDDPESPETADTFHKRQKHKRWFGGTFIGLGADNWDIFVIGNLPHEDCLIATLVSSEEWDGLLWRAINMRLKEERFPLGNRTDDGSALWPDVWPLDKLAKLRADPTVGDLSFAREMLNFARNAEDIEFRTDEFQYIDWDASRMKEYRFVKAYVDPAGGERPGEMRRGNRDYFCMVTGGLTKDNWVEIFDIQMHKLAPDRQMDTIIEVVKWTMARVTVEENMYKNLYGDALRKKALNQKVAVRVDTVDNTVSKMTRILNSQPALMDPVVRHIRFARHLRKTHPEFFAQYDQFPSDHDDGPDAVSGLAPRLYRPPVRPKTLGTLTKKSYWKGAA
jgi:predicted phage terminase large subunit-like protein